MYIDKGLPNVNEQLKRGYIALGNFDGVHLGHRRLIEKCIKEAKDNNFKSLVYTFLPHPDKVLRPDSFKGYINSLDFKKKLIESLGTDALILHKFTLKLANLEPESFVEKYLVKNFQPRRIYVGFNYSFGKGGIGNPLLLAQLGDKYDFEVDVIPPVTIEGYPISSSRIRHCLSIGDIEGAKIQLGYWPTIQGLVIKGDQRGGKKLGYPTANLLIDKDLLIPGGGVYATYVKYSDHVYYSVTNVGYNPTFNGNKLSVETHILDFNKSLYNEKLEVSFVKRLRGEIKFTEEKGLISQITKDIAEAKTVLEHKI
ncbi:MAG: bifunctional riboflavin kinase/FAD synthetase [Bacillota bacterium]